MSETGSTDAGGRPRRRLPTTSTQRLRSTARPLRRQALDWELDLGREQLRLPAAPSAAARPRLAAELDSGSARRVQAIVAPTGWGKTTAVRQWVDHVGASARVVWLQAEPADSSAVAFAPKLAAALVRLGAQRVPIGPIEVPRVRRPDEAAIGLLVEQLARTDERRILIVDDVHHVHGSRAARLLACVIDRAPPSVHVALVGRHLTPTMVGSRPSGRVGPTLGVATLRLTVDETSAAVGELLGDTSENVVQAIQARCDGWPAGLAAAVSWSDVRPSRDRQRGPEHGRDDPERLPRTRGVRDADTRGAVAASRNLDRRRRGDARPRAGHVGARRRARHPRRPRPRPDVRLRNSGPDAAVPLPAAVCRVPAAAARAGAAGTCRDAPRSRVGLVHAPRLDHRGIPARHRHRRRRHGAHARRAALDAPRSQRRPRRGLAGPDRTEHGRPARDPDVRPRLAGGAPGRGRGGLARDHRAAGERRPADKRRAAESSRRRRSVARGLRRFRTPGPASRARDPRSRTSARATGPGTQPRADCSAITCSGPATSRRRASISSNAPRASRLERSPGRSLSWRTASWR